MTAIRKEWRRAASARVVGCTDRCVTAGGEILPRSGFPRGTGGFGREIAQPAPAREYGRLGRSDTWWITILRGPSTRPITAGYELMTADPCQSLPILVNPRNSSFCNR